MVAPPIPAEAWKLIRDEASGFAVSLPEFVSPDKSVNDPPQRVYTVKLSHEAVAELTVAFIDTVVAPKRLETVVKAKEGTLTSQGATGVVISDATPALHAGKFAAYDFTTSYTLKGVKAVMWTRYIAGPKSFVVVATEVTGDAIAAEPVSRMREYHQRTVDSVVAI
ncbi:hypothetical protein [Actinokineospora xionganensis]|uniref:Uncharacterized protein n=1 Tax=Actinokineospora xionganensis TaxID=2684470 RepID=A0ABR7LDM4_9PSEU|nr:hypothetical protein [Actinokineospora xionganensis]MBC6450657.1 hypothetical protein [Actinokineospora xionganensis]